MVKRYIHKLVERLCYYGGIDSLFYWLNRKAKRIITFHNVLPETCNPHLYADYVSHSEEDFRKIVREIGKHYRFSVDCADTQTATITFDDGYLNQYEVAGRVLKAEGDIPAIIFAAGHNIDRVNDDALIVDKILLWLSLAPIGKYTLETGLTFEIAEKNRGWLWIHVLRPAFVADVEHKGAALFAALDKTVSYERLIAALPPEYVRLRTHGLTKANIEELRSRGWIVGWHTMTHFPLSALSENEARKEMTPVRDPSMIHDVFSYPYGEMQSVSVRELKLAQELGYPSALSNMYFKNSQMGHFFLPRMDVEVNKYKLHFMLSGAEYFCQKAKLLPRVRSIFVYPALSNVDLGAFRVGGAGLANCMFVAARACVIAKKIGGIMLRPTWERFGAGQFIRHESDKRLYQGLFKRESIMGAMLFRSLLFPIKRMLKEDDWQSARPGNVIKVSGLKDYFSSILSEHALVRKYFEEHTEPSAVSRVPNDLSNYVAVHVRLGDFVASDRVPLEWYVGIVKDIKAKVGKNQQFLLFSDGRDDELKPLLEIDGVKRVFYGNALADIWAISRCKCLIGSNSTFSAWGAYLGQVPSIFSRVWADRMLVNEQAYLVLGGETTLPDEYVQHVLRDYV